MRRRGKLEFRIRHRSKEGIFGLNIFLSERGSPKIFNVPFSQSTKEI